MRIGKREAELIGVQVLSWFTAIANHRPELKKTYEYLAKFSNKHDWSILDHIDTRIKLNTKTNYIVDNYQYFF